ncbi:uncharacterized protein HKW66_Vig0230260 [Vigna angularis]|uniref:Neprosin PEP catalytic domain-containing protein n=1 Tax=Phaseolus angularis TaxID=3914 RepID=A0A8T0KAZ4_PHAAN|nr:uncharacterized protein HKW66_Vig0230260 [Vigna angularis]
MFGLGKHECPTGTVPILRTTKDDLIREKSLLNDHILLQDIPGVHVAEVSVKPNYGPYYGVGGFVQTSKEIFIGRSIGTISQYGGRLCVLAFSITQDPITKNWWISIDNKSIGYFPAKLFSNMSSANEVGWGGRTRTHPGTQSPEMGSGHFPHDDNPTHACFYEQISIQDNERKTHGVKVYEANSFTDKPNCYDVRYYGDKGPPFGHILMFGGPGATCGMIMSVYGEATGGMIMSLYKWYDYEHVWGSYKWLSLYGEATDCMVGYRRQPRSFMMM